LPARRRNWHLPDIELEKHVIRVFVTPLEVGPSVDNFDSPEFTIAPVLVRQVNAVSTIFVIVPGMIVVPVPIVVSSFFLMMLVSPHGYGRVQQDANEYSSQNYKTTHIG
jgi:hypothetical protein